jgi:hypothetical protein
MKDWGNKNMNEKKNGIKRKDSKNLAAKRTGTIYISITGEIID